MDTAILQVAQAQSDKQTTKEVGEPEKALTKRLMGPVKWFFIWVIATLCYIPILFATNCYVPVYIPVLVAWDVAIGVIDYDRFLSVSEFVPASRSTIAATASLAFLAVMFNSYYFVMTPVLLSRFGVNFNKWWAIKFIPVHLLSYAIVVLAFDFLLAEVYSPGDNSVERMLMFIITLVLRIAVFFITLVVSLRATLKLSLMRTCQVSTVCVGMHLCSMLVYLSF